MSFDDDFGAGSGAENYNGIFAIRGDLDGTEDAQDFDDLQQFIGLIIGKEEFLLPIDSVNEIIMISQITFVPQAPQYVEGVINLRGKILPAIDLRKVMGFACNAITPSSRIVITSHEGVYAGIIVDAITYVISLHSCDIESQNLPGQNQGAEFIKGISKRGDTVNGILDVTKVVTTVGGGKLNLEGDGVA